MNKLYYVELCGYGCCQYTACVLVGSREPKEVFRSFSHPKVTQMEDDYVAAFRHEDDVMLALQKHFKSNGFSEIELTTFSVGD